MVQIWQKVLTWLQLGIMASFFQRWVSNWRSAIIGVWFVVKRPKWLILAFILAFTISLIIYFSINYSFYWPLLASGLPIASKLSVVGMMISGMVASYWADLNGILLFVVSLLQGLAIAILIYTIRRNRQLDAGIAGRSGMALVLATLGLGCVPCGTSLLVPVMTILFSSSAPALIGMANSLILVGALILTVYSLYKTGLVAYKYYQAEV